MAPPDEVRSMSSNLPANQRSASDIEAIPISKPRRRRWRHLAPIMAVAFMAAVVAAAMLFAIAEGTRKAADEGTVGILGEASLSAAAATRNGAAQANIIAEAAALGLASPEDLDESLLDTRKATAELERRVERFSRALADGAGTEAVRHDADVFVAAADKTVDLIAAGDLTGSSAAISDDLEPAYAALATQLTSQRDAAMSYLALAGDDAGRLADAARFLVVLLVPITALLAYRKRLRRDQERLEWRHRLEKQEAVAKAQDEFIANLSHELRTPLTAIYGFSLELIEPGRVTDPILARELTTYIASESADLSRMVEDILTAASADQGGLVVTSVPVDPVEEVASVVSPLHATGANLAVDMEPGRIIADPLRYRQVVRNLVSNALRHGGPSVRISGQTRADSYALEVRDNGTGVPAALEERLFSRFVHQGEEPLLTGSVGLGLSIAHLLTELTGGEITYRRESGETVFSVSFPLAEQPALNSGVQGLEAAASPAAHRKTRSDRNVFHRLG
jgi:signal transduction histidine kinase